MPSSRKGRQDLAPRRPAVQSEYSICTRAMRMDVHGPGGWCRPGLAQAEIADLALLDQARHGADGVLDRHLGIDPVLSSRGR